MKIQILVLFGACALAACSHKPEAVSNVSQSENQPASTASMEAKQVAAEHEAPYVAEITFQKGSDQLTKASEKKFSDIFNRAQKSGANIDKIISVAWADQEYPADQKKDLSKAQKDLAENRNKEIQNFFKSKDKGLKVETVSMAERPNALNEFLKNEKVRIKESLETAGISTSAAPTKGQSKASKAMAMIVLKDTAK